MEHAREIVVTQMDCYLVGIDFPHIEVEVAWQAPFVVFDEAIEFLYQFLFL